MSTAKKNRHKAMKRAADAAGAARAAELNWQREEYIRMCNGEGVYAPLTECEEVGRG